eukprot:8572955-Alexandrium_andersonii.AAC.1
MVHRDLPLDPLLNASINARIRPLSFLTAFSMAPWACGSCAGGDSRTVCTPKRSATARRKSTSAGSLS